MASRWDQLIEQADRIQKDINFIRAQIEGTMLGEITLWASDLKKGMDAIEKLSFDLVDTAEQLEQSTRTVAAHRLDANFKKVVQS